jgi:hypothetical protein
MFKSWEVTAPSAAAEPAADLGLDGDDRSTAAPCAPAEGRVPIYGKSNCPYGWVCVAEQHAHDLSPLALIDVYSLPEEDGGASYMPPPLS